MFNKKDRIWVYFIKPPLPVKMSPLFSVLCLCESEPVKDANKKSLTALWQVLPAEQEKFHWKESSLISCLSLPQIWLTFKIHLLCFRALLWWKQTFAESRAGWIVISKHVFTPTKEFYWLGLVHSRRHMSDCCQMKTNWVMPRARVFITSNNLKV